MPKTHQKTPPKQGRLITKKEAADRLCVVPKTIDNMIRDGELSSTKPRHKVLVPESEINALIEGSWKAARPIE